MIDCETLNNVGAKVKNFYNKIPFPGFSLSKYNSCLDLYKNANLFAKRLDYQIPYGASIVDMGCGTGQLACLLSMKDRNVLGIDFSTESLAKAKALAEKLHLKNVEFKPGDVLSFKAPGKCFDYVFCLGVLHHTSDPYGGFKNVVSLGKSGTYIIVGLYNKYGRLFLKIRQSLHNGLFNISQKNKGSAATALHGKNETDIEKDYSWFMDQYEHPYESTHTIGEVLEWFKENNIDYINLIPAPSIFGKDKNISDIFKYNVGNILAPKLWKRCLIQIKWIFSLCKTGGYFVTIGRIR